MFDFYIETKQDLADAIEEFGFVPYADEKNLTRFLKGGR